MIYNNLRVDGRFITVISHVENCTNLNPKYGCVSSISEPLQEGTPITLTFTVEGQKLSFDNYYLGKATYNWAFKQVGFKEIYWHDVEVSPAGIEEFGQEFWQDILEYPATCFIECIK